MSRFLSAALLITLAACATRPPTPPECQGDLVAINPPAQAAARLAANANATSAEGADDANRSGH